VIKAVKAHSTSEGLAPGALAEELQLVGRMLPALACLDTGCSYDLDDADVRRAVEFPLQPIDAKAAGSRSLSSLYRLMAATPTPKSRSFSSSTPDPSSVQFRHDQGSFYSEKDTDTNPDYMQNINLTPGRKQHSHQF
jgi:hypothetical protein